MEWSSRTSSLTGNEFYHRAFAMKWKERDSFALKEILSGNLPGFFKRFVPVTISKPLIMYRRTISLSEQTTTGQE
jgi:hypothetical protein